MNDQGHDPLATAKLPVVDLNGLLSHLLLKSFTLDPSCVGQEQETRRIDLTFIPYIESFRSYSISYLKPRC